MSSDVSVAFLSLHFLPIPTHLLAKNFGAVVFGLATLGSTLLLAPGALVFLTLWRGWQTSLKILLWRKRWVVMVLVTGFYMVLKEGPKCPHSDARLEQICASIIVTVIVVVFGMSSANTVWKHCHRWRGFKSMVTHKGIQAKISSIPSHLKDILENDEEFGSSWVLEFKPWLPINQCDHFKFMTFSLLSPNFKVCEWVEKETWEGFWVAFSRKGLRLTCFLPLWRVWKWQ